MAVNAANILSSDSLAAFMASSLPKGASAQLRDPYDAVALFSHACMVSIGFRLIGLGEDHKIGIPSFSHPTKLLDDRLITFPEATSGADHPEPLPERWNAATASTYAFRYAHTQSSLEYLVKITRLGSKAVINALGLGDDRVHSLDIIVKDFLSPASFPYTTSSNDTEAIISRALQDLFISAGRISDLGALFKLRIIQKIAPGLRKEGYEDSAHAASPPSSTNSTGSDRRGQPPPSRDPADPRPQYDPLRDDRSPPARPYPFDDPLAAGPRRPYPAGDFPPPGFEDEYEINRPPGRGGLGGERRPLNIGERDLYPAGLGPRDPFNSGGGGFGGGGMHPTFDDPMFGGDAGAGGVGGYGS